MNKSKTMLSIFSQRPLNIFGDIDVLVKMKLYDAPRDFIE